MRTGLTWSFVLPVLATGWFGAHEVGHRLAMPEARAYGHFLHESGHLQLVLVLSLVALLLAFVARAARAARVQAGGSISCWPFVVLPPLGIVAEELANRVLHDGLLDPAIALEPTFLVGLAVQVPFGSAAYVVARMLARLADRIGYALARDERRQCAPAPAPAGPKHEAQPRRIVALARGQAERGPPALQLS